MPARAMTSPLVTIRFESLVQESYGSTTVRHWSHVPRVGDWVEFNEDVRSRDGSPGTDHIIGTVTIVMWGDRDRDDYPDVVVRVK